MFAKILFPLLLTIYTLAVTIAPKIMFSVCPPPYAGFVLLFLILANIVYLLTFPIKPIYLRVFSAFSAPLGLVFGNNILGNIRIDIISGNLPAITFGVISGLSALIFAILIYLYFYGKVFQR